MTSITHYGHACVLVELPGGERLLFDPGAYSAGFERLTGLDAILLTHEHQDHRDEERLASLVAANPDAAVADIPERSGSLTVGNSTINAQAGDHAVVYPEIELVRNVTFAVDYLVYHPGDSFTLPSAPVRILLLPTGGPWMKVGEAIDFLRAVKPEIAIPIHQAGLAESHQQMHYWLFNEFGPAGTEVRVLQHGVPALF